jgi:large subunit ribosomal protein L22
MNTAARDRSYLPLVRDVLGSRTPIAKLKLSTDKDGKYTVALHTSRPETVRMEAEELTKAFQDELGEGSDVTVEIVGEARAVAKYVRTSPRKARLVIDAIKGMRVSEAMATLRFVPNHAAELISKVLKSAAANAMDGWGAPPDELKIVNILADGGPSWKRIRARAQGRAYRVLKRQSHLTVIVVDAPPAPVKQRRTQTPPKPKAPVAAPVRPAAPAEPAAEAAPEEATPVTVSDAPEIGAPVMEEPAATAESEGE